MLSRWELNAIVLCHVQRFFAAANQVVNGWEDPNLALERTLVSLAGNLLWVRSSFDAQSEEESEAMATVGALAGTFGGAIPAAQDPREQALLLLDSLERQCLESVDLILADLQQSLAQRQPLSSRQVNRLVWERLFPQYPYECGSEELKRRIRRRLLQCSGAGS